MKRKTKNKLAGWMLFIGILLLLLMGIYFFIEWNNKEVIKIQNMKDCLRPYAKEYCENHNFEYHDISSYYGIFKYSITNYGFRCIVNPRFRLIDKYSSYMFLESELKSCGFEK